MLLDINSCLGLLIGASGVELLKASFENGVIGSKYVDNIITGKHGYNNGSAVDHWSDRKSYTKGFGDAYLETVPKDAMNKFPFDNLRYSWCGCVSALPVQDLYPGVIGRGQSTRKAAHMAGTSLYYQPLGGSLFGVISSPYCLNFDYGRDEVAYGTLIDGSPSLSQYFRAVLIGL